MKYINLITSKNEIYREVLPPLTYRAISHNPRLSVDEIQRNIQGDLNSFSIIEIDDSFLSNYTQATETMKILAEMTQIVVVTKGMTKPLRTLLLQCGLPHCITSTEPLLLKKHFESLTPTSPDRNRDKILILDDIPPHRRILEAIINRLEYHSHFASDDEELLQSIKKHRYRLILINLETRDLDIKKIIRQAYANHEITQFPIIAYKDMNDGIFVHDFLNGLNKITKIILSPEELFCALFELLYKKRMMTSMDAITRAIKFEKYANYARDNISQIYYEIHGDLCNQENLCTDEHIAKYQKNIEEMSKILMRTESLRWLKTCPNKNRKTICGKKI